MSFLHPWALALSALVAIPLLIHLLHRDTRRRVSFPALRYLQSSQRQHARSVRLRDLLLLALRMSLVVLIALAAATPLVGRGGAGDHRPTNVAIVLDNSASMSRLHAERTLLAEEVERARITLSEAGPRDRFWIIPVVGETVAVGVTAPDAQAALERVQPTDAGGDIGSSARAAALALPQAGDREREVHLLTDLQASALGEEPVNGADDLLWIVPETTGAESNGALLGLQMSTGTSAVQGISPDISATAAWYGGDPETDSVTVRFESESQTAALAITSWGSTAVFRVSAQNVGAHYGKLQIAPSGIRADDTQFFALQVEAAPAVDHVGTPGGFVEQALATLAAAGRTGAGEADVMVVDGDAPTLPPARQPATDASSGSSQRLVLIPPADPLLLARFNQWLVSRGIQLVLSRDPSQGELRVESTAGIGTESEIRVRSRYLLSRDPGDQAGERETLLSTSDGSPWLVRGRTGSGTYVLLASPLDSASTSLPLSPGMIPFMENLVLRWSHGTAWPGRAVDAGSTLILPATADSISLPSGEVRRVDGGLPFRPLRVGVYRVHHRASAAGAISLVAVNVPASESDLQPASVAALENMLPGGRIVRVPRGDAADWRKAIFQSRRGADISRWLLFAVLMLALAEAWVASPPADTSRHAGLGTTEVG
ncbi:MAG: BatA and WFA domain-containing protein [Gemmatimonadota bacterium]